jgi:hypothetical protein
MVAQNVLIWTLPLPASHILVQALAGLDQQHGRSGLMTESSTSASFIV